MFDNLGNNNRFQQYNQQYEPQRQAPYPQQYQPSQRIQQNQFNLQEQQFNQQNQAIQQDSLSQFQQEQQRQFNQSRQGSSQQQLYNQNSINYQNNQQQQNYNNQLGKFQQNPESQHINTIDNEYKNKYGGFYQQQLNQQNQQQDISNQGIHNIKPRTRTEREAMKDKEAIEKTRINQRVGYESRNINVKDLISSPNKDSTLYIPENQRFDKDFSVFDKQQREEQLIKREQILEQRRVQGLERDARRWDQIENQQNFEQQKREYQSKVLLAGKRNTNGLPYNPLTLQYDKSEQGKQLKQRDEEAKVRAYVRSQNLDQRSNTGFNILTGENRAGIERLVPNHLLDNYQNKVQQQNDYYQVKWQPDQE